MISRILATVLLFVLSVSTIFGQANKAGAGGDDPVLRAMRAEMERSKSNLKLQGAPQPFYIEYRVDDLDALSGEASFGALRGNVRARYRFLHATVLVGDYKQDSFYREGQGSAEFVPLDDDFVTMRHQIWLATDKAYKGAIKALTAKQAALKQFNVEQPVDDFSPADPVQSIGPAAKLDVNPQPWLQMLEKASGVYKGDPQIEGSEAQLQFQAVTHYFMNSEGTVVRKGENAYQISIALTTQAADGMRLDRSHSDVVGSINELPSAEEFVRAADELANTLKELRKAPVADEEYRGPVMFSADAASQLFADFVGQNVLGVKPELGQPARTRGQWATSYKSRVLPDFISVEDDPTVASVKGESLLGHYEIDDEGVRAQKVQLIENGKLMNYVIGREPIRDFPKSNGHGRTRLMGAGQGPGLGNLIVHSAEPLPHEKLKAKLMELCRQRELPYGYYVETLGPGRSPRLLFKIDAKDGHEQLVRGASFGDLDTRALRNDLIAAGDDVNVENRVLNIPHSIVNPSVLFDELEVKRANASKDKLPEYPAPGVSAGQ
jgi:hypothetical protein